MIKEVKKRKSLLSELPIDVWNNIFSNEEYEAYLASQEDIDAENETPEDIVEDERKIS